VHVQIEKGLAEADDLWARDSRLSRKRQEGTQAADSCGSPAGAALPRREGDRQPTLSGFDRQESGFDLSPSAFEERRQHELLPERLGVLVNRKARSIGGDLEQDPG
jgi:hypothetical protein